jgi:hypothetical protein
VTATASIFQRDYLAFPLQCSGDFPLLPTRVRDVTLERKSFSAWRLAKTLAPRGFPSTPK